MACMPVFLYFRWAGTRSQRPDICYRSATSLSLCWSRRRRSGQHEAHPVSGAHVRRYELGRRGGPLLLRHGKERCVVKEQVHPRTQNVTGPEFQVEVISDVERFNAIADEWDRLVKRADVDCVFLSHAWLRTWWELFGQGRRLHVITLRAAGELVAAAPMMRS